MIDRAGFLKTLLAAVLLPRTLRGGGQAAPLDRSAADGPPVPPEPLVWPEAARPKTLVMGNVVNPPPLHPNCRCVTTYQVSTREIESVAGQTLEVGDLVAFRGDGRVYPRRCGKESAFGEVIGTEFGAQGKVRVAIRVYS